MRPSGRILATGTIVVLLAFSSAAGTCIVKEPTSVQPVGKPGVCATRLETGSAVPVVLNEAALEARFRTIGSCPLDMLLDCSKPGFLLFLK